MHHRYIGDKAFYRRVFGVAVPIIIQNGITNFVSLLDNIMVGQVGTVPMSGVSIVNGLLFVFNLCVFGASSGAGIFTAQFYGSKDDEGIRHTFRFKFLICIVISLVGAAIFLLGGSSLIGLYLTGEGDGDDEQIKVDLSLVPENIQRVAFTVTIYDADVRRQNFGQVNNAFIRIVDESNGQEILRYDLGEDFSIETAAIFGELYKHNGEWKFNAIGSGYQGGLAALCANYGVEVED